MNGDVLTRGTIPETTGVDRSGHVILGGLPLKKGQLTKPGSFRLNLNGQAFVVEGTPAAWWPDNSIKWLRLCGAVDLKGGSANPFTLETEPSAAEKALAVRHLPGIEEITGGAVSVRVSPDPHRVLEVRDAAGRLLTSGPGLSARMKLQGPHGEFRREMTWTFEPGNARVVTASRERVVIRLAGRFIEEGRLIAELVTFIEVVKDEPRIGIQPVLIYLGDPDRDLIASLNLSVHTVSGCEDAQFGFGQDRGPGYWDACQWLPDSHRWPEARLVQAGSTFYRLDKRTGPESSWVKIREGQKAQGWCHLGGSAGGVTGAMRYLWQEYPRTLAVDANAGTLTFGLIPAETEPLDLRRYSTVLLGSTNYEAGEGAFPAQTHGATGIAKSNELMVRFHPAGYDRLEAARAGLFWSCPARLIPDPEEFAASGVAGTLTVRPPPGCETVETHLQKLTDFMLDERAARGWYGLMNFGDVMQSYYGDRGQWAFDDGGHAWINSESLPDLGFWLMAFRYGRADWMEGAIAMSRHNRDVDMYHRGNFKGVGSRHNVNHWGCKDKEWRVSMPLVKRFHDYMTGDPWTREVILETVAVYQLYDRTSGSAPSMSSALAGLMVKAEMTGEDKDRAVLINAMDVYARAVGEDRQLIKSVHINLATGAGEPVEGSGNLMGMYFFLTSFGGQHTLVELAETYQHEALTKALVRHAELYFETFDMTRWTSWQIPKKSGALLFMALAYRCTGNPRFRDAIAECLKTGWGGPDLGAEGGDGPMDEPNHKVLLDMRGRNKIVCSIGDLMHLRPYGYAALD
ncbi:MAG: hypothetical protein WCL16_02635 [bacterium]